MHHPKGLIPIIIVIFIALIAAGVVGAAWYYDKQKDKVVSDTSTDENILYYRLSESQKTSCLDNGGAIKESRSPAFGSGPDTVTEYCNSDDSNPDTNSSAVDTSSTTLSGFLYLDPPTYTNNSQYAALKKIDANGAITELTTMLIGSANNSATYQNENVYYVTKEVNDTYYHTVGVYDIQKNTTSTLFNRNDSTDGSIKNIYFVAPDLLYYLQGPCVSVGDTQPDLAQCDLYRYNITSDTQELLIHNVYDQLESTYLASLWFSSYDAKNNIFHMVFAGGDAGHGTLMTYSMDVNAKTLTQTKKASYAECGEPCPTDQTASNQEYQDLMSELRQVPACGSYTFNPAGRYSVYKDGSEIENLTPSKILTCYE